MRVLVAEHQEAVRRGIRSALVAAGAAVVAECGDAASAIDAFERERPDVCVVDVDLPGDGLSAATEIRRRRGATRVVMLGSSAAEGPFFDALAAGVSGFLLKDVDRDRLAADVIAVGAGRATLAPELASVLIEAFRSPSRRRCAASRYGLTEREGEVIELLARGLRTKEVAHRLGLSPTTVRRHVSSAVSRLGVADRRAALELVRAFTPGERE
jgi:DNA-binding NarL/FixJ family response regulator